MSRVEELLYSAEEHGKRSEVLRLVTEMMKNKPAIKREDAYESAYQQVMHT